MDSSSYSAKSWIRYGRSEEEYIDFEYMKTDGTVLGIDTEDALVKTIRLNGQSATLAHKGEEIHAVYVTEDQQYLVYIYSIGVSLEDFLRSAENLT